MTDIAQQLASTSFFSTSSSNSNSNSLNSNGSDKCPLCAAIRSTKPEMDDLRHRIDGWADQLQSYEADDATFVLHSLYDQYAGMVAASRHAREQQSSASAKRDIVRYHSMSIERFAEHFKNHAATRETRNVQKNDDLERLYTRHLTLLDKFGRSFDEFGKEDDLKKYTELIKSLKLMNDISVSPRFLPFHNIRKSIHK